MKKKKLNIFIFLLILGLLANQVLALDTVNKRVLDSETNSSNSVNANYSGKGGGSIEICLEPPPVNNLTYLRSETTTIISFKTPNFLNLSHFVARIATSVYQGHFDSWGDLVPSHLVPQPIMNATQTIELNYLNPYQKYYFGIQLFNYCGNKSLIAIITLEPLSQPVCLAPSAINYLNFSRNKNNAVVKFKTPNLNNLSHFVIRYATSSYQGDFQNWGNLLNHNLVPIPNATQTVLLTDLTYDQEYYLGIKLFNNCGKSSEVAVLRIPVFYIGDGCDPIYPVEQISAQAGLNQITLTWLTPRALNPNNNNFKFEIRKSLQPINNSNFYQAEVVPNNLRPIPGAYQSFSITNLNSNTLYYFAIVLKNECDQFSPIVFISQRTLSNQIGSGGGGGGSFGSFGGGSGSNNSSNNVLNYSIVINNNEELTNDLNVLLTLFAENAKEMMVSNYADFRDGYWLPYQKNLNWRLLAGEGLKTVYAKFRSLNNNISEVVYDEIFYQSFVPVVAEPIVLPVEKENPSFNQPILVNQKKVFDFNQLMVNWLKNDENSLKNYDLNNDKRIDYEDVKVLFNNWQDIKIDTSDYKLTNFSLEPKYNLYLKEGEEIKIVLLVKPEKNQKNYSAQVVLNYLPSVLEFKSFEYGKNWIPVLKASNYDYFDKEKGVIVKTAGYPQGFDEEKIFGVVTFKAKKEGQTLININNAFSLNDKNEDIFKGLENSVLVNNIKDKKNGNFLLAAILKLAEWNIVLAYLLILLLLLLIYGLFLLLRKYVPIFLGDEYSEKKDKELLQSELEFNLIK